MWQLRDNVSGTVERTFREGDRIRIGNSPGSDVHCDAETGALWEVAADATGIQVSGSPADITLNGRASELPLGVRSGDVLQVGGRTLRVELDAAATLIRDPRSWLLCGVSPAVADVSVPLADDLVVVGRDEDCDVVVDEGHVSRHHAHLERAVDGIWLTDLDSRNGTFVDGERIRGARRLQGHEQLTFDETVFELRPVPAEPPDAPPDPNATLIRPAPRQPDASSPAPVRPPVIERADLPPPAEPEVPAPVDSGAGSAVGPPDAIVTTVAPAAPPTAAAASLPADDLTGSGGGLAADALADDALADDAIITTIAPAVAPVPSAAGAAPPADNAATVVAPAAAAASDAPASDGHNIDAESSIPAAPESEPAPQNAAADPVAATRVMPPVVPDKAADAARPRSAARPPKHDGPAPVRAAARAATVVDAPSSQPAELAPTVQIERPLQPVLVGRGAPIHGDTYVLRGGTFIIGRGRDCDIVVPERSVSSRHARLIIRPDEYTVTNLTSSNGIFVNGERVVSKQLSSGDVVSLGRIELIFAEDAAAAERALKALRPSAPLPGWAYVLAAFAATIGILGVALWALRQFSA